MDKGKSLPQYSGQRVRHALGLVELKERKPVRVKKVWYSYLAFDSAGYLDEKEALQAAADALDGHEEKRLLPQGVVIPATARFNSRRHQWKPNPSLEEKLLDAMLGQRKVPST